MALDRYNDAGYMAEATHSGGRLTCRLKLIVCVACFAYQYFFSKSVDATIVGPMKPVFSSAGLRMKRCSPRYIGAVCLCHVPCACRCILYVPALPVPVLPPPALPVPALPVPALPPPALPVPAPCIGAMYCQCARAAHSYHAPSYEQATEQNKPPFRHRHTMCDLSEPHP